MIITWHNDFVWLLCSDFYLGGLQFISLFLLYIVTFICHLMHLFLDNCLWYTITRLVICICLCYSSLRRAAVGRWCGGVDATANAAASLYWYRMCVTIKRPRSFTTAQKLPSTKKAEYYTTPEQHYTRPRNQCCSETLHYGCPVCFHGLFHRSAQVGTTPPRLLATEYYRTTFY